MTFRKMTNRRAAAGFTLVELLVVIAIIAILASFVLGALYGSQEKAKHSRTQSLIAQLHTVVIDKWESYRTRRLPITSGASTPAARLSAIRQLMRMELPDRYKDLEFSPTIPVSSQRTAYIRKIEAMRVKYNNYNGTSLNYSQYLTEIQTDNQSAECLHLIMTVGLAPEDRPVLRDREIGDTDSDGMPEILDGWGNPIEFLRWAPGFVSDLQPIDSTYGYPDPLANHDAFDPLRISIGRISPPFPAPTINKLPPAVAASGDSLPPAWGFNLVPLIISAGPDGEAGYGLLFLHYTNVDPTTLDKDNNPYARYPDSSGTYRWRGTPDTDSDVAHLDNIHNHLIGAR